MTFNGSKLKQLREAKLWSRLAFSKRLKVSDPQIGRWESGAASPRGDMAKKVARVLGVAVSELFSEEKGEL